MDYPCQTVDFLFNIKSDFEIFDLNCRKYLLCFLRFNDELIKEFLSDLLLEGVVNILKSGYSNPISTFFSNILIIEGPLKLKQELFGSFYKYVDNSFELNYTMQKLVDLLIKVAFDKEEY